MMATSGERCPVGTLKNLSAGDQAIKVHGLKKFGRTYMQTSLTSFLTSVPIITSLVFPRISSVYLNEFVLVPLALWNGLNSGCKRFIKCFLARVLSVKFRHAFPFQKMIRQEVAHAFRGLTTLKPVKLKTRDLLFFVARLWKKKYFSGELWRKGLRKLLLQG